MSLYNPTDEIIGYTYTDEKGEFAISLNNTDHNLQYRIEIACLGYVKLMKLIESLSGFQRFTLQEKAEYINEVVVESGKKIKIDNDTTFIKVASFANKTEQTVEDILKKLPGIEVLKDGTIKAHGKVIDKLLIEGEDMFDKNYKLLSKNLDAKVLDEVEILDSFEDNPIFKKLNNSDKVAINLKLKKGLDNIWFGNLTAGAGIVSENRWKESINVGLIKKRLKLFYFGDYNNIGDKATDLISTEVNERSNFGTDRVEYKAKSLFVIPVQDIPIFTNPQFVFNIALLNSVSLSTKIGKKVNLRGVIYVANDNQLQNSTALTFYNLENNPVTFVENNLYNDRKLLSSVELELKYSPNDKNYVTNLLIVKSNDENVANDLLFNTENIDQWSVNQNRTLYNHFNHTLQVSDTNILNTYIYFGIDQITERTNIRSAVLNSFLSIDNGERILQKANNKIFYSGVKTKIVSKFRKMDFTNAIQLEYNAENYDSKFQNERLFLPNFNNDTYLLSITAAQENGVRYNFSRKIDFTANLNFYNANVRLNDNSRTFFYANPSINLNIKKTGFGNFSLLYSRNNALPDINQLTTNAQLIDYRNFRSGATIEKPVVSENASFKYYFYNDENRYSINSSLTFINSKTVLSPTSTVTDALNFTTFVLKNGSKSYNYTLSLVNYTRKLKLASKLETSNSWMFTPLNVNSQIFETSQGYINSIKYAGTTYLKLPVNFDFGFSYNYFSSRFQGLKSSNATRDYFIKVDYKILSTIIAEANNSVYFIDSQNYFFNNIVLNYTPIESRWSFRFLLNNLANEQQFTNIIISDFSVYRSSLELLPRYILATVKYRF